MHRKDAIAWVVSVCTISLRLSQAKTLAILVAAAMRVHDGKTLKPLLSESYSIEGLPEEHNAVDFFMQAMVKLKAPDDIVILSVTQEGEARIAKMEFRSGERGTKERRFKFDAKGKLLSADFFTLKRQ